MEYRCENRHRKADYLIDRMCSINIPCLPLASCWIVDRIRCGASLIDKRLCHLCLFLRCLRLFPATHLE